MSEKHPGPLVVEGKLTDAERMKLESNYLRGTIAEDLNDGLTGGFKGDNFLLIRFHGMYQQDDRDIRAERAEQKLEPRHAMLLRCRLPGGVITTKQWQAIDKFAGENTIYGSIRLTNRQTFQFHGILKKNVKPVHQMLHSVGLDALATANDMNRNVLCTSNLKHFLILALPNRYSVKELLILIGNFIRSLTLPIVETSDGKKIAVLQRNGYGSKTTYPPAATGGGKHPHYSRGGGRILKSGDALLYR